jgi:methionyl aminopeptidase
MKPADIITDILNTLREEAKVGVNILELEKIVEQKIIEHKATSATKNYHPSWSNVPFSSVICMGVNDVITHPIPKDYILKDGDLLHMDCTIYKDGRAADAAQTIPIGNISKEDQRLLKTAKAALYIGIEQVKPGIKVSVIGEAIEKFVKENGYVVNRIYTGHGIGKKMHQEPSIPHTAPTLEVVKINGKYELTEPTDIPVLQVGQTICIEPMLTYTDEFGVKQSDGWTVKTKDKKNSAVFEHMIRVTETGYQILTSHIKKDT